MSLDLFYYNENIFRFSTSIIDMPKESSAIRKNSTILINDDTRLQAYGWSLSSKNQLKLSEINGKVQVNVPVPVYCRPIFNSNDTTQVILEENVLRFIFSLNLYRYGVLSVLILMVRHLLLMKIHQLKNQLIN